MTTFYHEFVSNNNNSCTSSSIKSNSSNSSGSVRHETKKNTNNEKIRGLVTDFLASAEVLLPLEVGVGVGVGVGGFLRVLEKGDELESSLRSSVQSDPTF